LAFRFEVLARHGAARRGRLTTAHGVLETPAFMPVATLGAVKGLGPQALEALGAEIQLCNLYHLAVRPGVDTIERAGGLHAFVGWRRPILTDSGGYQVMSLAARRRVDEDGVSFRNHVDGAELRFEPETVVRLQERLGVDIAMALDECPPWPAPEGAVESATIRTARWMRRALQARERPERTALFGIVQGGTSAALRRAAIAEIAALPFDGIAIGGVSVGEPQDLRRAVVESSAPLLPADKPRYLMGVGTPEDLAHAVAHGVDLFDCVLPARNARHGTLFTRQGPLHLKNAIHRGDPRPPDPACPCSTCERISRGFLHHLFQSGEITAAVLATTHNLRYFLDFMRELREASAAGSESHPVPFRANPGQASRDVVNE
jgi:queuine tRNA-ribosyltransferase